MDIIQLMAKLMTALSCNISKDNGKGAAVWKYK